jgi:hypothetical protein
MAQLLLLLALLCASGAPGESPTPESPTGPKASCFTMEPPGPGWRRLELAELRELDSAAQVGLAGPRGVRALLFAETSNRLDLEACVEEALNARGLEQIKSYFAEATQIEGRPAAHALVSGRRDGLWWRYHVTAFREGGELYQLVCWGPSDDVPADGSTFLEATLGLREIAGVSLDELQRSATAVDSDGPGWRVRAGVYRDAALGFALQPRGAWRVAMPGELKLLGLDADIGLIDELHEAVVGIVAERLPGMDLASYAERCRRNALSQGHPTGSRSARVAGREIELRLISLPGPTGYADQTVRSVFGVFSEGDRSFQITARYPASQEAAMSRSLPQALASFVLLDDAESLALAEELTREGLPVEAVGPGWCLRNGVYTNFADGYRWHTPAGFWDVQVGTPGEPGAEGTSVTLLERRLGLRGTISVNTGIETEGAAFHAAELAALTGGKSRNVVHGTEPVQLGDVEGLVSSCELKDPLQPLHVLMATGTHDGRGYRISFSGTGDTLERASQQLGAALVGMEIAREFLAPTVMQAGTYRDERMGFELAAPRAEWSFRERKLERFGPRALAAQGVVVSFEGPAGAGLHAGAAWTANPAPSLDQPVASLTPAPLATRLALPDGVPLHDERATFRGRPCRLLTWQDGERRIELVILVRGATTFALAAVGTGQGSVPRDCLAGFRLLD